MLTLIANSAASAPPLIEKIGAAPSTSFDVTVVTAVWFSAAFTDAVAPPPLLVITGASFTGCTRNVTVATFDADTPSNAR